MSGKPRITLPTKALAEYCCRWKVTELDLFGSVLRDDFGPNSDVDVLVSFDAHARPTLMDIIRMEEELSELLGRKADLVERQAVEQSENYIRRRHILSTAEPVYVEG
jgi:hypothetical protein